MATKRKNRSVKTKRNLKAWLIKRYGSKCWICKTEIDPSRITIDHVLPLVMNGPDNRQNMKPACSKCNGNRGAAVLRLMSPGFYRAHTIKRFQQMLERMVFVERQLQKILTRGVN